LFSIYTVCIAAKCKFFWFSHWIKKCTYSNGFIRNVALSVSTVGWDLYGPYSVSTGPTKGAFMKERTGREPGTLCYSALHYYSLATSSPYTEAWESMGNIEPLSASSRVLAFPPGHHTSNSSNSSNSNRGLLLQAGPRPVLAACGVGWCCGQRSLWLTEYELPFYGWKKLVSVQ
jgi:hypothetical protein